MREVYSVQIGPFLGYKIHYRSQSEIHCATLPSMGSDHWPDEIMRSGLASQFKNPFRFEHFWLENSYFDRKIKTRWEDLSEGDEPSMYKFQQKLKDLKVE